jgi:uncharacterized protein with HEPN domain
LSERSISMYLADMLEAIDRICEYTSKLTYSSFSENEMVVDAVLRNLEVLGEAARYVPQETRNKYTGIPWSSLVGLRNIVIHHYHGVDLENIWQIARKDLPPLRKILKAALAEVPR